MARLGLSEPGRDRAVLALLVLIGVFRGLLWIGAYPVLKITDEPAHFDNIQFRAEHGMHAPRPTGTHINKVMPVEASVELRRAWDATQKYWRDRFPKGTRRHAPEERELNDLAKRATNRETSGQSSSMFYPPVYYALGVPIYRAFQSSSVLVRLFALRCYSLAWGLVLVVCTYLVTRWTVGSRPLAFAAALFVMLQPMAAQQTVGVNNDAAVIGLSAIAFALQLALLRQLPGPARLTTILSLAVVTALAIETKPQAYGLLPGSLLIAGWLAWSGRRIRTTWLALGGAVLAFLLTRGAVSLLLDRPLLAQASTPSPTFAPSAVAGPSLSGFVDFLAGLDETYLDYLFKTAWGNFCWLDFSFSGSWFGELHQLAELVWLGLAAAIIQRALRPAGTLFWSSRLVAFSAFTSLMGAVVLLGAEYYASSVMNLHNAIQGRAIFFVLPALTILGVVALASLVPRRLHALCAAFIVAATLLIGAGALITVVGYQYVG